MKILLIHCHYRLPGGEDAVFAAERALLEQHGHTVVVYERSNEEAAHGAAKALLPFRAVWNRRAEALTLLCSETRPDNQLYVRYRRYTLRHAVQETAAVPLPAEDTLPAAPGPFELLPDEAYNLQHRDFDLVSRNAGPFFLLGEQIIHPTQVSTTVDYGVYLQFLARRGSSEVPLCAATPQNVEITGLAPADIIGIHTYCRDDILEIIDARYLTRIPKIEKPEVSTPAAE